jgi:hypothetical protein
MRRWERLLNLYMEQYWARGVKRRVDLTDRTWLERLADSTCHQEGITGLLPQGAS